MDKLIIEGPCKLKGEVHIGRAKNAYLPILTATILSPKNVYLKNVPKLRDISTLNTLIKGLGVHVLEEENQTVYNGSQITNFEATYDLVKTMRASILVLGPLLARFKKAKVSLPGGCAIGARPIDIHLKNLEKMGAEIKIEAGYVEATCKELVGAKLVLSFPSVGATENLMMAATLAKGETIIENAALEPEIIDLGNFLQKMGVEIEGLGTSIIKIKGLSSADEFKEVHYEAIGDRIEAATYLMAGLITKSEIKVNGINPDHLDSVTAVLSQMGASFEFGPDFIKVNKCENLKGVNVETSPYPGLPTDVQAQLVALATQCEGTSVISEKIFENRFMHVPELKRLGSKIELRGNIAIIQGKADLISAPIMCTDLRASAALVLAALASKGVTEIQRIYHLDRGYECLEKKLESLGANIKRLT